MTFDRLAPDAGIKPRRAPKAALLLAALTALLVTGIAPAALAAGPLPPLQTATPFSWVQFKQSFGVYDGTNFNELSLPGTPTVPANSAQITATVFAGQQIESWLLGDIGVSELPIPKNYMRDLGASGINVENWLSPFYNLSLAGQANANITIDDLNTDNSFGQTQNPNLTYTLFYGTYVDGTLGGVPASPLDNPSNGTPPTGAPNNANGWETAQGDLVYEQNFYDSDYRRTTNSSATVSDGLVVRADPTKGLLYNGASRLATWAYCLPNNGAAPPIIQSITANPASPTDATNSTTPPVSSNAATLPVTGAANSIIRNVPVTQSYDAYAYFPSEDASQFSSNPELHIDDAEYTVQITNPFTSQVIYSFTSYVDQTTGGAWVKIAGPFAVPIVDNPNPNAASQSGPAIVTITLDNTTGETVNGVSVTQLGNYHVVADAVQLRPDNGFMYGSPVAVNVSDYPELGGGYSDGAEGVGGLPITYRAAQEQGAAGNVNGASAVGTNGGNYFAPNANNQFIPPAGEYTEDQWGNKWQNGPLGSSPLDPLLPSTVTLSKAPETGNPIDQVVYVTRSENISGFQGGAEQTVGAVYAIDGLTGNVIWRYPSTLPFTLDDAQGAPNFTFAGTSTNGANAPDYQSWTEVTGPDTDFFGTSYAIVNAGAPNDTTQAVATWTVPASGGATAQNYNVYVWFPSQTATELHTSSALYTVAGVPCVAINQQSGGQWVQLTQTVSGTNVFSLAAGSQITLTDVPGSPQAANTYVVADAVLIVPANAPGPITSTPVVVRNMRVLTNPTTNTYSTRTCVLFTDNSVGGITVPPTTLDDDNSPTTGWQPETGPDTNFHGNQYSQAAPGSAGNFRWLPNNLPAQATGYYVYVWYPVQNAAGDHVTNAQYFVGSQQANPVDQTVNGGTWVQLTWHNGNADPKESIFTLLTGNDIELSSTASGGNFVVADAVMIVPVHGVTAFTGGRVYCLDAAGNGDGDDTTVDQNGEPVSYDSGGNLTAPSGASAGFSFLGPLQPLRYGTTQAYWIWQPNPEAGILQNRNNETQETGPDPNRDMPVPGAYELNSPSIFLEPDDGVAGKPTFNGNPIPQQPAVVLVGNSNGYLYALDGQGTNSNAADPNLYYQSVDPNTPSVDVYWWFGSVGGIAYAPAIDANTNDIAGLDTDAFAYVTGYDPQGNNQGRLYAARLGHFTFQLKNPFTNVSDLMYATSNTGDLTTPADVGGPIGNDGKGDPKVGTSPLPGSFNYNIDQVPFWSFPDAYGTVLGSNKQPLPNTLHLVTSTVAGVNGGKAPAFPLGDIAGAPSVYSDTTNGTTRIYIAANEPTPDGLGPATNGRIYAIYGGNNGNPAGTMAWAYPEINGDPNSVGSAGQQATVFDFNPALPAGSLPHQPLGPFTMFDAFSGLFVSSSPVEGQVTFPKNLFPIPGDTSTTNLDGLADNNVQMLYTGGGDGVLYAINIGQSLGSGGVPSDDKGTSTTIDTLRLIYNEPIGEGPIYSTPVLLSGSAVNSTNTTLQDVGGVVFLTTGVGNIWEFEATPFTDPTGNLTTAPLVNRDWGWAGPGGLSSPAVASFNTIDFATGGVSPLPSPTTPDDSEWIYCGSDAGFLYGFTPNTSSSGGFVPGNYIPSQNVGPNNSLNLSREILSAVDSTNPAATGSVDWNDPNLGLPPKDPAFDWGQSVWIVIAGIDNPAKNDGTSLYPIGQSIQFTLTQSGQSGRTSQIGPLQLVPGSAQIVPLKNFPPAQPGTGVENYGENADHNYYAYVYKYERIGPHTQATAANGAVVNGAVSDPATPGGSVTISNIVEEAIANGATIPIQGSSRTPLVVNTGSGGTSSYGYVQGGDEASFGILNPIAVAGGGVSLGGAFSSIALSPSGSFGATPPQTLGPFNGVDGTNPANFGGVNGFQWADANGNAIPITQPIGGSVTLPGGGTINPTQSLSSQGTTIVGVPVDVVADPGLIGHGTAGDTGTGFTGNPQAGSNQANTLNAPLANASLYGPSMLVVGDRSALGANGGVGTDATSSAITNLRMGSPNFRWTDNSTINNANAVINMLPWDQQPDSGDIKGINQSIDYPDIPGGNIHTTLEPRTDAAGAGEINGTSSEITQTDGVLANSAPVDFATAGIAGQANRTVRPNPVLVQIDVPKYQPANLETNDTSAYLVGNDHSHIQNTKTFAGNVANWMPEGYRAHARIFVDLHHSGTFESDDAYREVNVWVGVPVDMSMQIAQSTTDIGAVPDGFGLWNPNNADWAPYYGYGATPSQSPVYQPWYVPVTVYNTGNVNLLNVHFDQSVASYSTANGFTPGYPGTGQQLGLASDTITDQLPSQVQLWPFYDTNGAYTGTAGMDIVRSNLDSDVYLFGKPTGTTATINTAEATVGVPGPTAHKARPGEAPPGEPITIPDQPHDASNPDTVPFGNYPWAAGQYQHEPVVSVAVPLGTPAGTYSQVLRTFEGSDVPYDAWTGPTYGQGANAYNPQYFYNPGIWSSASFGSSVLNQFVFDSGTGTPLQFYSDPGTILVAHVVENRLTDDAPILANIALQGAATNDIEQGALAMIDPPRLLGGGANAGTAPPVTPANSNDIQPWAFPDTVGLTNNGTEPSLGLLWPSARASLAANANNTNPAYDILATNLNGGSATAGGALIAPTSAASWWGTTSPNGVPDNITANESPRTLLLPDGTTSQPAYFTSYSPFVVPADNMPPIGGSNGNTALRVDSFAGLVNANGQVGTSQLAGAPTYAIRYMPFSGTEPPIEATTAWNVLEPISTTPIFAPRGCYVNNPTNPAMNLTGQPLIIFWSETSGGRSQIYYQSPHNPNGPNSSTTDGYPLILSATPTGTAPTPTPGVLPIPAGVSSVSNPTPVTRPFLYPWPDGTAAGTIRYWPVVDVTYSGVSTLTGETDVYTSRYIVWKKDPTNNTDPTDPPMLVLVPFDVQPNGTNTPMQKPETQTLVANSTNTSWEAQDVGWVRDLSTFTLWYTPYAAANPVPLVGQFSTSTVMPVYDKSSGNWVFTGVTVANWLNNETQQATVTIYVNPSQGTVRFSTPPSPKQVTVSGNTQNVYPTFAASFVPQAMRATMHSGSNTMPVSFVDEAGKPNTLQSPAGTTSSPQPVPIVASRYWYVWRKSGASTTAAASTASTLYFKTKRLTVVLAYPVQYAGNLNNPTPVIPPRAKITINGVLVDVPVDIDPGHYIYQNTTGGVPQMVPGRIYFPDYVQLTPGGQMYSTEGAPVEIQYTAASYTVNGGTSGGGSQTQDSTIQWLDEPYTNSPTDTAFRAGEREIPISNIVNESQPCAFLDPLAYSNQIGAIGNSLVPAPAPYPHRVWLFWVSTRNAGTVGNTAGTGADIYWEALDPRFSTTSPP